MKLLDKIKLPETLRELSARQLEQVAADLREVMVEVVLQNGGHIASSLGAVELAVSLHACFQSPRDKILWDVGHQAYAHKILTGRLASFKTLRKKGGVSAFPNAEESEHDVFTAGHASNSISWALGLAKARDFKKEDYSVIAVIGDASLCGGLAWEGLNNAVNSKTKIIIIINDNEMSISKNVGALSNYLTRLRTNPFYIKTKERIERLIKRIPTWGPSLFKSAERLKERTKHFLIDFKTGVIFEELGFRYFGPIDGHNIPLLMSTLHFAREEKKPVMIHVLTKKGKGYPPAERDPTRFHGISSLEIKDSEEKEAKFTYTDVFSKTMVKLGAIEPQLVAVTAAMPDGTGLVEFARQYAERFFDVGIAEEHAVTFSAGLAKGGFKPVVAIYSTFLQRAYDEIMEDVCLQNLPVVFSLDRAGVVGGDGATHQGIFDLAFLRTMPHLVIAAPKDENELQHLLYTAVKMNQQPFAIRYPKGEGPGAKLDESFKEIPLGKAEVLYRSGRVEPGGGVLFAALGSMVDPCLKAAKELETEGFSVKVLNLRFLAPFDRDLFLKEAKDASLVISAEEGIVGGGLGSLISQVIQEEKLPVSLLQIGLPLEFIGPGTRSELLELYGLSPRRIIEQIKKNALFNK